MCIRHIRVLGLVQGVGFRYACRQQARALGLSGWVRNDSDGSVEIVAQGLDSAVQALIDWCHEGPPGAHVRAVHVNPAGPVPAGLFDVKF
jgi:acylphosphatase